LTGKNDLLVLVTHIYIDIYFLHSTFML